MTQTEHQARRAMSAAHDRHLEPPDEGPEAPALDCPTCGAEGAANVTEDTDEDGRCWIAVHCDRCATGCTICGDKPRSKTPAGLCQHCENDRLADEAAVTVADAAQDLAQEAEATASKVGALEARAGRGGMFHDLRTAQNFLVLAARSFRSAAAKTDEAPR